MFLKRRFEPTNELERHLSEALLPLNCQRKFVREFVTSPLFLLTYAFLAIALTSGAMRRDMLYLPLSIDGPLYMVRILIWSIFLLLVAPYTLRFCAVKRIPFGIHFYLLYASFITIYYLIFGAIISEYSPTLWYIRYTNQLLLPLPIVALFCTVMGRKAALSLFENPELHPTWRPYRPRNHFLASEVKKLRYMRAQPPHTEVITRSSSLLINSSLSTMIERFPEDLGWRVHRSFWVAKSEIIELKYVDGNPNICLREGEFIPVSRKMVREIKTHLDNLAIDLSKHFVE